MVNNTPLAAFAILSVATTSAFVPSIQRSQQCKYSKLYDASDGYLEQLGSVPTSSDTTADHEKFQRTLLEAKVEYDTIEEEVDFDSPILNNPSYATPLDHDPIVDDECYLGKDGDLDECVDFDPLVSAATAPVANKQVVKQSSQEVGIVPVNEATIEFTAGLLGGAAGLVLGGPILGAVGASACNYLSRKDSDESSTTTSPKKVVDTASQTTLNVCNQIAKFESDNKILDSTFKFLGKMFDKAKDTEAGEALSKVESTMGEAVKKVEVLNDEYDLVGGAETLLNTVGDFVEASVDKVVELNNEYNFTDRAMGTK